MGSGSHPCPRCGDKQVSESLEDASLPAHAPRPQAICTQGPGPAVWGAESTWHTACAQLSAGVHVPHGLPEHGSLLSPHLSQSHPCKGSDRGPQITQRTLVSQVWAAIETWGEDWLTRSFTLALMELEPPAGGHGESTQAPGACPHRYLQGEMERWWTSASSTSPGCSTGH